MYTVDDKDNVVSLEGLPRSDVGAPIPFVFSDEFTTIVTYIMRDANSPRADDTAFVKFHMCYAHMFGPPNEEAFRGHPLAGRGLKPFGAFRVEHSSWVRQLERMNSVHRYHKPESFDTLRHYILTFHDSTFECLAESFSVKVVVGPVKFLLEEDEIDKFLYARRRSGS